MLLMNHWKLNRWSWLVAGFVFGAVVVPLVVLYVGPTVTNIWLTHKGSFIGVMAAIIRSALEISWPTSWLQVDAKQYFEGFSPAIGALTNGIAYALFFTLPIPRR